MCEKWDDGKPFLCSMLQTTISVLVDYVHSTSYLTCPVTEFLAQAPATATRKKQDGATAPGRGSNPLRILPYLHSVPPQSENSNIKYNCFMVGGKGECTKFGFLGRCVEMCPCKHVTSTVPDYCQGAIKEALEQGLAKLAKKMFS
jgi:hypothetical protein